MGSELILLACFLFFVQYILHTSYFILHTLDQDTCQLSCWLRQNGVCAAAACCFLFFVPSRIRHIAATGCINCASVAGIRSLQMFPHRSRNFYVSLPFFDSLLRALLHCYRMHQLCILRRNLFTIYVYFPTALVTSICLFLSVIPFVVSYNMDASTVRPSQEFTLYRYFPIALVTSTCLFLSSLLCALLHCYRMHQLCIQCIQ